ncbi:gag-pol polyprotein [Tanacetum coccineum]
MDPFDNVTHEPQPVLSPVITELVSETTSETTETTSETTPDTTPQTTPLLKLLLILLQVVDESVILESYREAVCDPLWQVAMVEELVALYQTQTWDLVPLPVGKRAIDSH